MSPARRKKTEAASVRDLDLHQASRGLSRRRRKFVSEIELGKLWLVQQHDLALGLPDEAEDTLALER
jgi:hypothetical protein